ncbi:MAG: biopolymer transporter ExbD [Puniceicoccales bacterium]|jgi:biopolymer transport protein ExbD|nr:biopolymer transporter ExbD [Puniceicoccales bacterium]
MPVSLRPKIDTGGGGTGGAEARIEIIPLIDIMFFLLASFMLVSLGMVNLRRVPVNLPPAATAENTVTARDLLTLSVDKSGVVHLEQTAYGPAQLAEELRRRRAANPRLRVVLNGDKDALHGGIVAVMDAVRAAGIEQIAIQTAAKAP